MITAETIAAALRGTEARYHSGTGWFSNGHFAVRGAEWTPPGAELKEKVAASIEEFGKLTTEPVSEVPNLRIARVMDNEACGYCLLGEVKHDDCDHCTGHLCENCDGTGRTDVVKDTGQAVFIAGAREGHETVTRPQYAALLEGLTVARNTADAPARALLLGYTANNELCVVVMPMLADVRPAAVKP